MGTTEQSMSVRG